MTKRIRRSGKLIYQSFGAIRQHKKLFVFPLLASLLVALLLAAVITPLTQHEKSLELIEKGHLHHVLWFYVIFFVFLFIMHQITFYFNSALTDCTQQYFKNKIPSLRAGIKMANHRFFHFFLWHLFAATLGIIFNLFQGQVRKYPFYEKLFQGLRWTVATYFAIPVILSDKTGPVNTIKQSAQLMRKTWGIDLKTNFGFLFFLLIARLLSLIPLIVSLYVGGKENLIIGSSITVAIVLIISMINSATRTILCSALYLYASEGLIAPGFNESLMKKAFRVVKRH